MNIQVKTFEKWLKENPDLYCETCESKGYFPCDVCDGKGNVECFCCGYSGECQTCDGKGKLPCDCNTDAEHIYKETVKRELQLYNQWRNLS